MRRLVKKLLCGVGFALLCNQMGAQSLDQAKKLYNEGEYAEAKPAFEKLVKQSPGNASYNLWYGVCCYETGDLKAAEKYLSSAVKRRVIEAYRYMGELYYRTYRFAEAVEMYDDYIDLQTKKKRDTEAAEARQEVIEGAQRMMEKVEAVQVIDSMVVDKDDFLSVYTLSEEMGTLESYAEFCCKGVSQWEKKSPFGILHFLIVVGAIRSVMLHWTFALGK